MQKSTYLFIAIFAFLIGISNTSLCRTVIIPKYHYLFTVSLSARFCLSCETYPRLPFPLVKSKTMPNFLFYCRANKKCLSFWFSSKLNMSTFLILKQTKLMFKFFQISCKPNAWHTLRLPCKPKLCLHVDSHANRTYVYFISYQNLAVFLNHV